MSGKRGADGFWAFTVKNLTHNHEPSKDMSDHSSFRQLSPNKVKTVKEMTMSGIPPRQILSSLRLETPSLPANSRTIYNLKKKIRREKLGNRPMINALFEELEKAGFTYDIVHDLDGRITRLFIAHPLSIKLAKHFSSTFVMDCTYKTNKYNMPLLDIIGISCFSTTFYSGFVFLEKEDEENYVWALSAFKKILGQGNLPSVIMTDRELALMNGIKNEFPATTNLLCVWHIEKNVLANCKKYFGCDKEFDIFMGSWQNVIYSATEAMFEYNWAEFELFYNDKKGPIDYIKKVWLPWKEKFVSVWTEKYLHFGTRTMAPCTSHFTSTMGLPCAHKIQYYVEHKMALPLHLIHPHWRFDSFSLDSKDDYDGDDTPVIKRPKGRPPKAKKKKGITSTTRDPSRFEYVELSLAQNYSSSTFMFQRNNEVTEEFGYGHHGNLMDLSVSSDFPFSFTSSLE
uniref:protein FAR1-RELATED SEQUENCE 5-like n=1 Tax=Erigeron canadensis TaxID=72917 RepID=UPI001CB8B1B9|nr:protein FAR1-RELATED SEQUENCE 5-like [Erigeron canadensis]